MGQGSEHISQILAFVSDNLQVVSYKWLSRKLSISSNEAKRLLQIFVEQHGGSVEVVYAVSGWSKMEPQCHSIQLVPKLKLQQAKDLLDGHVSSHVYSVQPCIPKDPVELWNAEFVQSEELFNESANINNCLRDNRFSAVSCLSIARKVPGKPSLSTPSFAPKVSAPSGPSSSSKPPAVKVELPSTLSGVSEIQSSSHQDTKSVSAKDAGSASLASAATMGTTTKGAISAPTKKQTTGANFQAGGSLANLWGRAKSKPKPNSPEAGTRLTFHDGSTTTAGDMNVLIQAHDTTCDGSSSDDDAKEFARLSRGQAKNSSGRKRRVVFEDEISDVEKDPDSESILRLSSPKSTKERKGFAAVLDKSELGQKPKEPAKHGHHEGQLKTIHAVKNERVSPPELVTNGKYDHSKTSVKEELADSKISDPGKRQCDIDAKVGDSSVSTEANMVRYKSQSVNSGPKKRKVVKTRIDGRGREVTEVIWENEDTTGDTNAHAKMEESKVLADKSTASMNAKASTVPPNSSSRSNVKSSGKTTKDNQQGKIMSFFKKKT